MPQALHDVGLAAFFIFTGPLPGESFKRLRKMGCGFKPAQARYLFNGQAGTILMRKFADANHSYFRMQMKDDIPGAFLQFALLLPLLYLFLTLSSSRRQNGRGKALTLIAALFIGQMVSDALKSLPLIAGVPAGIALLFFLLWQSGKLEEERDVP